MLPGRHLVVVLLDAAAHRGHRGQHLAAHVLRRILRRDGEVAGLGADAVAEVAALVERVRVAGELGRVQHEAGVVRVGAEAHVVEHEELRFRAEVHGVADAGGGRMSLALAGDAARIARVGLARRWLDHVAHDRQGRGGEEGIHRRRGRVRHQHHVGLVDRLPAGDGGAVEHGAVGEDVLVDHALVEGDVLPLAPEVGEAQVDVFDVVVLDRLQHVGCAFHVV